MKNIRAIGFDYGGVLAGETGPDFARNVAKMLGISLEAYRESYFKFNKQVNRGEISWPDLWRLFLQDLGLSDHHDELIKMSESYQERLLQPRSEMLQLIDTLRDKGYKLGLLSNNTLEMARYIDSSGTANHFDIVHVSARTGLVKPEVQAFTYFAECLGVVQTDLVFIDDSERSLSTSHLAGYTPLLFTDIHRLRQQLKDLGIDI